MRARKVIAFVGLTDTGKTTQIKKMIKNFKHGKVFILDKQKESLYACYAEINPRMIKQQQNGIYRIHTPFREEQLKIVDELSIHFKDGLIVLEDAATYIPKTEYRPLVNIMGSRRHQGGIDLIMTFHSINRIPVFCLEHIDIMILFKTNDNAEKHLKGSVPQPQLVQEFYKKVEAHPSQYFYWVIDLRKTQTAVV